MRALSGYADDLIEIGRELELKDAVFVGHSVSAMIGVLASLKAPDLFESLVLVGPSPRYINDGDYVGGFSATQIDELLDFLVRQLSGLVGRHGARDHGQSRSARTRRGADQQFLPHRSGDRQSLRAGHLHVGQSGRPSQGHEARR